jgi:GNAT superfamily N-acetyltransferase
MEWRIESGGDAVPGGYNGYFIAYAPDGTPAGYLDYQSATDDDQVLIAMVEVQPTHRRKGLATLLLARLHEAFPGRTVRPGYQTDDGAAWWRAVSRRRSRTTREDRGSQLRIAGGTPWTEAMTRAWFTPQAADRPDDLPRGIAVPRARTRDVAEAAIGAFLELRGGLGGDEEEARRRAVDATVAKEAAREHHGDGILTTYDGTPWTDAMGQALFDLRAAERPTDLPWNLGVPPARVRALADDAIGLLLEYRDQHGRDEEQARLEAVAEVVEGEEARELIEWPGDHHSPAPREQGERGERRECDGTQPEVQEGQPTTGAWVSYLEYGGERGTLLAFGHVVAGGGASHVLIRPENAGPEDPLVRKHWSQVDYHPFRREGETIEQVGERRGGGREPLLAAAELDDDW